MNNTGPPHNHGPPRFGAHSQGGGGGMAGIPFQSSMGHKPKVGLAVVCRCKCAGGNNYVQCLLQRRGIHSSSPNKWSFPGGRLEHPGDLEDDGAVGTRRELFEECGGGAPPGLPPLIHIECSKTGKQSQTLYHVYVVDTSLDKEWETWQPKSRNGKSTTDVDTVVSSLTLQTQAFPCTNGYCWVDMSALIQECYGLIPTDLGNSDLQHGLVRWVQNHGEHILKTLIARSPKLPHTRRLSNPIPPAQNGHVPGSGSPRQGATRQDSGGKPRRFNHGVRGGMLQPPYQFPQHNFHHLAGGNPAGAFFGMGVNQSQLSPTNAVGGTGIATPTSSLGVQGYPGGGMVVQLPPGVGVPPQSSPQRPPGMGPGVIYVQPPPIGVVPPPGDSPNHPMTTRSSSPVVPAQNVEALPKSDGAAATGAEVGAVYLPTHTQGLISSFSPLMVTSAMPLPSSSAGTQPLMGVARGRASPGQFEQQQQALHVLPPPNGIGGVSVSRGSIFPLVDAAVAAAAGGGPPVSAQQFPPQQQLPHHPPPPPSHPHPPPAAGPQPPVSINTPAHHPPTAIPNPNPPTHTPQQGDTSEPLLPNPPLPPSISLLPVVHSLPRQIDAQQASNPPSFPSQHGSPLSTRKEILCRHYVQGNCPFGEKCWFAHPEPLLMSGQAQSRPEGPPNPGVRMSGSALNVQVPPNFWLNNPIMDYAAMASPPQSPLNPALARSPLMFRPPRGYAGQQPYLFLRGALPGSPRLPGANVPLIQTTPISMPVNPILNFELLSQVMVHSYEPGEEGRVMEVSQLATFADHFFISYKSNINTYKIIFGGSRNYQESAVPIEKKQLDQQTVSCLVCSQQQPMLLLVGTEEGGVSLRDMRKGAGHGTVTPVHSAENPSKSDPISALIHFSTSINSQVVVTGTQQGVLCWHIAQPPQKTFSLLYQDKDAHHSNKIVSLQMLGGFLMSGDTSGKVAIWSMMSQTPTIHSTFQAHSLSLTGLHVMDANHFLTIGNSDSQPAPVERDESTAGGSSNGSKTQLQSDSFTIIPSSSPEQLSFDMSQLSIQPPDEGGYDQQATDSSVRYWEYGKPPKMLKAITDIGAVISSSFHCHNPPGNMFLGLGMHNGIIKIYNVPNFTIASELHFPEMKGLDCTHIRLNLSREAPLLTPAYYRNPFRDLILTSTWSDGKIMVCQVKKQ